MRSSHPGEILTLLFLRQRLRRASLILLNLRFVSTHSYQEEVEAE